VSEYDIRPFEEADLPSLLTALNETFAANDPDYAPRTEEQWRWAYERNPAGQRIWVAVKDGEVAAHYASYPYRVSTPDGEMIFAQIVDSFVHPAHRKGLKKPGLFVEIGLAFLEATSGPDKDVVSFGWPVEAAWRIGEQYFDYLVVRTQGVLAREPGAGASELPAGVLADVPLDEQVRWLYDRCAGDWGASVVRDDAYLRWRYRDNPFHDYETLGVRDADGILRGLAVTRHGDWLMPNMELVLEWLVPPGEPEVADLLHEALLARARAHGASALAAMFPEWTPWFEGFQERGWLVHPTDYVTVSMKHHPRYDAFWLRQNWWYQLGDTDLV
jgi:hypothetical protein